MHSIWIFLKSSWLKQKYIIDFSNLFQTFSQTLGGGRQKNHLLHKKREIFLPLIDQFCLIKIPKGKEFQQGQKNNDWLKPGVKLLSQNNYVLR